MLGKQSTRKRPSARSALPIPPGRAFRFCHPSCFSRSATVRLLDYFNNRRTKTHKREFLVGKATRHFLYVMLRLDSPCSRPFLSHSPFDLEPSSRSSSMDTTRSSAAATTPFRAPNRAGSAVTSTRSSRGTSTALTTFGKSPTASSSWSFWARGPSS